MDLILAGGTLFDPASAISGRFDIGFQNGRVAEVAPRINPEKAKEVIDVTGKRVVPGLIDMHSHVYHGGTSLGVCADHIAHRSGVTTFVDAGSAGAGNYAGFHDHVIKPSRCRILAFLNISFAGIYGFDLGVGECVDIKLLDPDQAREKALEYVDEIIGVKVRVGRVTSGEHGDNPVKIAKQAADRLHKPLMSHIDYPPPTLEEVLQCLGKGDILTHCFRPFPNSPVTEQGAIINEVRAARERGVVFDVGHGRGSFGFGSATKMLEQGFEPDVISSDVHSLSIQGPAHSLLHVMSKFMALGMSFETVIEKTTVAPARAIDQTDLGHLGVGARGDVTILDLEKGSFDFFDVVGEKITADTHLRCDGLVVDGVYWAADP